MTSRYRVTIADYHHQAEGRPWVVEDTRRCYGVAFFARREDAIRDADDRNNVAS